MYGNKYSLKQILLTESKYQQAIGEFTESFVQYYLKNPRKALPKSKAQLPSSLKSSYNIASSKEPDRLKGTTLSKGRAHLSHIQGLIDKEFGGAAVKLVVRMDEPGMKKKYGLVGQEDLRIELDDPNDTVILISSKAGGSGPGKSNRTPTSVGLFTKESLKQVNTKLREALATPAKLESLINLPAGSKWPDIYNAMMAHTGKDTKEKAVLAMFEGAGSSTVAGKKISKSDKALRTLSSALTTYFGIKGKDALIDILRNLNGSALIDKIVGDMFKTYYPSLSKLVQDESNIKKKLQKIKVGLNSLQNYYAVKDSGILSMTDPDNGVHANLYAGLNAIASGKEVFVLDTSTAEKLNRTMYICVGTVPMLKISVRKSQTSTFKINAATADIPSAGTPIPPGTRVDMNGTAEVTNDLEIVIEDEVIETSAESDDSTEALELVDKIKEEVGSLAKLLETLKDYKDDPDTRKDTAFYRLVDPSKGRTMDVNVTSWDNGLSLFFAAGDHHQFLVNLGFDFDQPRRRMNKKQKKKFCEYLIKLNSEVYSWSGSDAFRGKAAKKAYRKGNAFGITVDKSHPRPEVAKDFVEAAAAIGHIMLNESKASHGNIISERWARLAGLL